MMNHERKEVAIPEDLFRKLLDYAFCAGGIACCECAMSSFEDTEFYPELEPYLKQIEFDVSKYR